MANEITFSSSLSLSNGALKYSTGSLSFQATQTTKNGPTPGAVSATTSGTTVSLSQLTAPGWCVITNTDPTNFVKVGLYISSTFYPFAKLLKGQSCIIPLSEDLLTANAGAAVLRLKADTATCVVVVNCLDA